MRGTDDLIISLAQDASPVSRWAVEFRVAAGIAAGAAVTFALVASWLGFRPDLLRALGGFAFWMKAAYTMALSLGAIALTLRFARPDAARPGWLWLLALPVLGLAFIAVSQFAIAPAGERWRMWMGGSARVCPELVFLLAIPIFLGLAWALRRLAPTRLRATGGAAGFAAGTCAATIYGLHCTEAAAGFVLTWYTLGICFAALAGALVGPRLLRW